MHSLGRKLRYYTPNFLLKSPSCKVYINISSFSFRQDKYLRGIALSCKLTMVMMAVVPFCWPESLQTIKICGLPSQFYQHFFIKKTLFFSRLLHFHNNRIVTNILQSPHFMSRSLSIASENIKKSENLCFQKVSKETSDKKQLSKSFLDYNILDVSKKPQLFNTLNQPLSKK